MSFVIESAYRVMALLFISAKCWCGKNNDLGSNTGNTVKLFLLGMDSVV